MGTWIFLKINICWNRIKNGVFLLSPKTCFAVFYLKPDISNYVKLKAIRQTWMVSHWWQCRSNHSSGTSLSSVRNIEFIKMISSHSAFTQNIKNTKWWIKLVTFKKKGIETGTIQEKTIKPRRKRGKGLTDIDVSSSVLDTQTLITKKYSLLYLLKFSHLKITFQCLL